MSLDEFFDGLPFEPDPFQLEAGDALLLGDNLVVTAPTGAGKTLVADAAIHLAMESGRRVMYTTPIKALSNQKYGDLVRAYGEERVGLLTGDNVINGSAPVVVMTTEVLRNMIYADESLLVDVEFVVLDEVHYLQDPFRGGVWEEVIIHAPRHVRMVALSATIANAEEFADWMAERRGRVQLVETWERPVPLESMYMLFDKYGDQRTMLLPTFTTRDGRRRPNPKLEHMLGLERGRRARFTTPRRLEVIEHLAGEGMLPAIFFVFSRAGCDAAALSVTESGMDLAKGVDRERVRAIAEERTAHLADSDLAALGYARWVTGLEAGVAAHHAGLVPAFKETVEDLFANGHLKVVFATETLALGINMPARTVVLESLSKFDGEGHSLLEPGDYTQLTGRAGRRGIDTQGYGVVLHSRFVRFDQVTRIAATGSHPLRSSFRPTYNMAVNMVGKYTEEQAERLLDASFAQFQRRGSHVSSERKLEELMARFDEEMARATCERGSVADYAALVEGPAPAGSGSLIGTLHAGDVIDIPGGPRAGRFVVLRRLSRGQKGMRLLAMSTSGKTSTLGPRDITRGSVKAATLDLPRTYRGNDPKAQQATLRRLRSIPDHPSSTRPGAEPDPPEHPVAGCPDARSHLAALRKAQRTERRIDQLRSGLRRHGVGLVEEFRAIQALLEEWGYLDGWALTPRGSRLRFLYNELDLVLSEAIERGLLWDLTSADFAAVVSSFVYEPRTDQPPPPVWPNRTVEEVLGEVSRLSDELAVSERAHGLPVTARPDPGFVHVGHAWAGGVDLEDLPAPTLPAGDFVRVSRQVVDLLRQIRDAVPELADVARAALDEVDRGVVAAQGVR